ncbi:MAG: FHA domain-containing protein [Zoogloeaceae bacterium]|jgi:hypothetical protein|nr:FHA domain-containing protein [Zoogloeaceae bacterium]
MIWIELLSRHKEVTARHPLPTDDFLIGRGYDNALVIDDPYVAPRHLRVFRDANGGLMAEDLGTQNGLYDEAGARHVALSLDGNTLMRIGQTWLRAREADFPVPAERKSRQERRLWPWLVFLLALAPLLQVVMHWSMNTGENSLSYYLDDVLPMMMSLGLWVGLWALLSRLVSGAARVARHTTLALLACISLQLYSFLQPWAVFAFSSPAAARYDFVGIWLLMAAICLGHLYIISVKRLRQKAAIMFSLAVAVIVAQWLTYEPFKAENRLARSVYLETLFPPSWRVTAPESEADFFADVQKMEARLEELRKEDAPDEEDRETEDGEQETEDERQSRAADYRPQSEPGGHSVLCPLSSVF